MKSISLSVFALLISLASAWSKDVAADPLAGIVPAMEAQIAAGHTAGAVTLVMKDGKIVHHAATGFADREQEVPMTKDALFWIASMTKSMSVTTIMTLVDEGKLSLDEPAATWMPAIGEMKMADGSSPEQPVTLRLLMSHTSGLQFPPRKANDGAHSLRSYAEQLVKAPLSFQPGSDYEYGFGITVSGRIAEIVSGQPFDELVQQRIFDPLGMKDTAFHPNDALRARIAKTYKTDEDGRSLVRGYNPFVTSDAGVRRMTEPSGGVFSTAADMAKFYQMILDGGVWEGKRIVSEKSIAEMTSPRMAGEKKLNYGLGWMANRPEKSLVPGFSASSFGHGGAFATHGWVDPERGIVAVLMIQNVMVQGTGEVRKAYHEALLAAYPE
ncbi:MAG: beta-lactamase family protein [Verrucomicrobiae bacterium]|nr:beta-lactamase family protein [Verrucomicrobiae bacterium]